MRRPTPPSFLTLATLFTLLALLIFSTSCVTPNVQVIIPPLPPVRPPGAPIPLPAEVRGVWIADPRGLDWEWVARDLASARINTVFVKFSTGGAAYYPSSVLPFSGSRQDEAGRCVTAMHRYGIGVHAWHVNLQMKDAPYSERQRAIRENRVQRDPSGQVLYPSYKGVPILCPSSLINRQQEVRALLELARLGVEGVQLDHIRFCDGDSCYCANCHAGFERYLGARVHWPRDAMEGGAYHPKFRLFRQATVTQLVGEIRQNLRALGRPLILSAAVFPDLQNARQERGQDWKTWVENGSLDLLCPMNYNTSRTHFDLRMKAELDAVEGRIPVVQGIGIYMDKFTPRLMLDEIADARRAGARGFVLFNYDAQLGRKFLPSLR